MSRRAAAWVLPLAVLCSCSYSVVQDGELSRPRAERIVEGISALRELRFRSPVPMEVKSPDELRGYLEAELARQYTPDDLDTLGRLYETIGLLPPRTDLTESLLRLYTAQVAGFYDPRAGRLFLVHPSTPSGGWFLEALQFLLRRDLVGEMLLAHELTHALQDQNFAVLARADDPANEDRALAAAAVIEGDATLAGFAYVFGGLPTDSLLDLVQRLEGIPGEVAAALPETPAVLRDSLIFRYTGGASFVAWAYLQGGWRAVDALLAHPPGSTEQILWPEKYFVTPDDPTEVHLGGLDAYRDDALWKLLEENTLGELMIRVLVEEFFPDGRAAEVARGWDGDRYAAFARDGEMHVWWMTLWDSERDAVDFFQTERHILARHFPAEPERQGMRVSAGGESPWWIERRADRVLVALGVPPAECAGVAERVWSKTTFSRSIEPLYEDLAKRATSGSFMPAMPGSIPRPGP